MRILCIEDNKEKYRQIKKIVKGCDNAIEMIWEPFGNTGLTRLKRECFSLIILDMSLLINKTSKDPNMLYGESILDEIKRLRISESVFVITGFDIFEHKGEKLTFEELHVRLESKYSKYFIDMVHYDRSSVEWAEKLKEVVCSLQTEERRNIDENICS